MTSRKTPRNTQEFVDYRLGETDKLIDSLQVDVKEIKDTLNQTFATKDYVDNKAKSLSDRLDLLEEDRKWFIRLIIGAVVLGIIGAYVGLK